MGFKNCVYYFTSKLVFRKLKSFSYYKNILSNLKQDKMNKTQRKSINYDHCVPGYFQEFVGRCQEVYRATLGHRHSPGSMAFKFLILNLLKLKIGERYLVQNDQKTPIPKPLCVSSASFHNIQYSVGAGWWWCIRSTASQGASMQLLAPSGMKTVFPPECSFL